MKSLTLILLCCIAAALMLQLEAYEDRKILVSKFAGKTKTIADIQVARKKMRDQFLTNLNALPAATKTEIIRMGDEQLKTQYPVKTAWDYAEYHRDGNRNIYEGKLNNHRRRLAILAVAQLVELEKDPKNTKYISEIINGIWMICEESTWVLPAHHGGGIFPIPGQHEIDLGAGEVAKFLGWIKLLLGEQLDHASKVVNERIDAELKNRIFQAYLDLSNIWWEGFNNHVVNNWNIWINGNILMSGLMTLNDNKMFDAVMNKTMYSGDFFIDNYGEDGGCDEGPSYWRQAGGRLIEFLDTVDLIFPEAKAYFQSIKLIKSIGEYSYKMLIEKDFFVNFADASARLSYPPSLVAKFGILFNDDNLKHFAGYNYALHNSSNYIAGHLNDDLNEFINLVNLHKEIESYKPEAPILDLVWLQDIQVVNSRSKPTSTGPKLFIAAKAGNNHESHNHNDVGNFILYQNGHPVLIDVGVGTYTAQTFGPNRYDLFYMQSQYHNCPTINGVQQKAGDQFNAHNTTMKELTGQNGFHFSSDIAGCYPQEAHVKSWVRSIEFDRIANAVQLDDQYQLVNFVAPQKLHFMTLSDMKVTKIPEGVQLKQANVSMEMHFDSKVFTLTEEDRSLDGDHHLTDNWGQSVKRITLTAESKELSGHFTVKFINGK